jgi:hypothetical protein
LDVSEANDIYLWHSVDEFMIAATLMRSADPAREFGDMVSESSEPRLPHDANPNLSTGWQSFVDRMAGGKCSTGLRESPLRL